MDMGGGRLIRIMILVLVMVLVWKIWDYSSLPAPELPSFDAKSGISSSNLQKEQEQNSVLQAPMDEHLMGKNSETYQRKMENKGKEVGTEKEIKKSEDKKTNLNNENQRTRKEDMRIIKEDKKKIKEDNKVDIESRSEDQKIEKKKKQGTQREVAVTPTMRIEVYYEVLCPDSRHFVMKQLTPAYQKLKDILQVGLVPYGKAVTREYGGKVSFECQHGPRECEGNIVHACVTNVVKDEEKQIGIVHCMIDRNEQPMVVGKKCVEKFGEDWGSVSKCVGSDKGTSILKHMGEMTQRLKPAVTFIPTITIDGSQEDQKHILQDFHKVLCKRYKGPKPPSC